jgi:phage-related minor tail protein
MIETGGRRFVRAEPDFYELRDAVDRAERAEAAERRERRRRIEAEETADELAQILTCEIAARQHAEMVAAELQALIDGPRLVETAPVN